MGGEEDGQASGYTSRVAVPESRKVLTRPLFVECTRAKISYSEIGRRKSEPWTFADEQCCNS